MLVIDSRAVQAAMLKARVGVLQLARLAQMRPNTISDLSRIDKPVRNETLLRLADSLQVEPMTLVKAVSSQ